MMCASRPYVAVFSIREEAESKERRVREFEKYVEDKGERVIEKIVETKSRLIMQTRESPNIIMVRLNGARKIAATKTLSTGK